MGKQINFYMSEKKQNEFVEYLCQDDFMFLNYYSEVISRDKIKDAVSLYLYKKQYGEIVMNNHSVKALNLDIYPVIELSKTSVDKKKKIVHQGRLWMENKYFDNTNNLVKKNEQYIKDYQKLVRWIKKNVPYQEINKGNYIVKEYVSDEMFILQEQGYSFSL